MLLCVAAVVAVPPVREQPVSTWRFQPDPGDVGRRERWFAAEQDRRPWRNVKVPAAWDDYADAMRGYEGVGWFATTLPAPRAGRLRRLRFDAVYHRAEVYLDGSLAGASVAPYLPFEVAVPEAARELVVRIDNRATPDHLPGTTTIEWPLWGGLIGPVRLVEGGTAWLDGVGIDARPEGAGARITVAVDVTTSREPFAGHVRLSVGAQSTEVAAEVAAGQTRAVRVELDVPRAARWSPEAPALHTARVELRDAAGGLIDVASERFGVRTIEVRGRAVLLNGAPLVIRGVNRYDFSRTHAPQPPEPEIRRDLLRIKQAGANLIRMSYPQAPVHYRLADELGLLVLEEVPICWWKAQVDTDEQRKANVQLVDEAERALELMVKRDRNHPSVIIWGMANESHTHGEVGTAAMERLMARTRELDRSRLVTYVTSGKEEKNRAFAHADLVALNSYWGWFFGDLVHHAADVDTRVYGVTRARLEAIAQHFADKPLLVTEFGAGGVPGFHGDARYTEEVQAAYLEAAWRAIRDVPAVVGGVVWSWADYEHRRTYVDAQGWPTTFGAYGLVDRDGREKASLGVMRRLWKAAPSVGGMR